MNLADLLNVFQEGPVGVRGGHLAIVADSTGRAVGMITLEDIIGERAKRASLLEDEHTRDEVREMATDIMATSTTKLTHPFRVVRSFRPSFIKNAYNLASLGEEEILQEEIMDESDRIEMIAVTRAKRVAKKWRQYSTKKRLERNEEDMMRKNLI